MEFSAELLTRAYRAQNGEYAWTRSYVGAAVAQLAAAGEAILGGEVWVVVGAKAILAIIPDRAGANKVYHWSVPSRGRNEPWPDFVRRAAAVALDAVEGLRAEEDVRADLAPFVRYNLTYVGQAEYATLGRR
jgi:hypothetical protein